MFWRVRGKGGGDNKRNKPKRGGQWIRSGKWEEGKGTIKGEGINGRVDDGYESHPISSHLHDRSSLRSATHYTALLCFASQPLSLRKRTEADISSETGSLGLNLLRKVACPSNSTE